MRKMFNLREGKDDDIIEYLDGLPENSQSEEIRAALRKHMGKPPEPSIADIIRAVEALRQMIEVGNFLPIDSGPLPGPVDEPAEAARNVDNLLSRLRSGEFGSGY